MRSDRQLSLGAAALTLGALARLRKSIRRRHAILAKRLGIVLMTCSGVHDMTQTTVRFNDHRELYTEMATVLSISAFVLHAALALARGSLRA